jgi:PKD repeat protein
VTVVAAVSDPGAGDVVTVAFDWGGGGASSSAVASAGRASRSNFFIKPGVYTVSATATDDDGGVSQPATVTILVYDPAAHFLAGSGTITSPPGAYRTDPSASGTASFGFLATKKLGSTAATGGLQFVFGLPGLTVRSTGLTSMSIAGATGQFAGTATVNGSAGYRFLVTATDGAVKGGSDKFRLKVLSPGGALVYDNGAAPDSGGGSEGFSLALISGSIIVHR